MQEGEVLVSDVLVMAHRPNGQEPLLAVENMCPDRILELVDWTPIKVHLTVICSSNQGELAASGPVSGNSTRYDLSHVKLAAAS